MKVKEHPGFRRKTLFLSGVFLIPFLLIAFTILNRTSDDLILSYTVDPQKQKLQLYWKNDKGQILNTFANLKQFVESKNRTLLFAMNGGMFLQDFSPLGLYIENGIKLKSLNKREGKGNFYLRPNGVFYLSGNNIPKICKTQDFIYNDKIKYATQSGPMLVIDGIIHTEFKKGSTYLKVRNGVGILPGNKIVFAMSKKGINLYDFAKFFQRLGCKNALYLDGFVSRTYLPEKNWIQTDGKFGVMIGVTSKKSK